MKRRAFSLVEILIVGAILVVLMAFLLPRYLGGGKDASGKKVASPPQRARQVTGTSYRAQIEQAIQMYKMDHDEQPPATLTELTRYGVSAEMLIEPVSKKPYGYNPQTGQLVNPN